MKVVQVLLLMLFIAAQALNARPSQVILLRHAEKPSDKADLDLSPQGLERARALVPFLTTSPSLVAKGLPVALFATQPTRHGHSRRPFETLAPLATHLKLPIQETYAAEDYKALAKHILNQPAYEGKTVVICWVHTYLPDLAKALGVKSKPGAWKDKAFDRVWLITFRGNKASLTDLPQKLLPGDSTR